MKNVEEGATSVEVDQKVDIAVGPVVPSGGGSEQANPLSVMPADRCQDGLPMEVYERSGCLSLGHQRKRTVVATSSVVVKEPV